MVELSREQIEKLKQLGRVQKENLLKVGEAFKDEVQKYIASIYTCNATGCHSGGAGNVIEAFKESLETFGLQDKVRMVATGCMGLCASGPLARVEIKGREPFLYKQVTPDVTRLIVSEHIAKKKKKGTSEPLKLSKYLQGKELSLKLPFFTKQKKVVLKNLGHSDPENLGEYVALGGYQALMKCLEMKPEEVLEIIKKSGLRGRGGAGFPTGKKWEMLASAPLVDGEKFIVCNGDEGDPGAYMDSCILGGGAHQVLEGMMIGAYATGATSGWFYIRAEYPLALQRVELAIKQAKKHGILGRNIFGSNFNFMADLRYGAGAFVCGEETALLESLEGQRGTPHPRPPYPTQKGLFGKPTAINNVETLANIAPIILNGPEWFSSVGTATSKGTKVFALTGKVNHSGLVEVPMGTTVGEMVNEVGGGTSSGKPFKAVQTGGPSGGVIPASHLDMPLCYEELKKIGSMMGSGGMIVMDHDDSMVEIAKFYLNFTVDESCGKCAPCRIGGYQMLQLVKKIAEGKGTQEDLALIEQIGNAMKRGALCGLGQTAPNPVLSTIRFFHDEYEALIQQATEKKQAEQKLKGEISKLENEMTKLETQKPVTGAGCNVNCTKR